MEQLEDKLEHLNLEPKTTKLKLEAPTVCKWYSHKGTHCRLNTLEFSEFCKIHSMYLSKTFKKFNEKQKEECSASSDVKIIPRSFNHVKEIMKKLGYDDPTVSVKVKGNDIIEDCNIENEEYIELDMDKTKYYYIKKKGLKNVGDLRLIFKDFCGHNADYVVDNTNYCEKCYIKKGEKLGWPNVDLLN